MTYYVNRTEDKLHTYHVDKEFWKDDTCLTAYQTDCVKNVCRTTIREQKRYIKRHPEISAMLKMYLAGKQFNHKDRITEIRDLAHYFVRPIPEHEGDIKNILRMPPEKNFEKGFENLFDINYFDVNENFYEYNPSEVIKLVPSKSTTPTTLSSTFLSGVSSLTTPATPEPEATPVENISEMFFTMIINLLNKATTMKLHEDEIKYDTAYVELIKLVELAMEISVTEIKEDIEELFQEALQHFECIITEKEKIAAELAWEKRMRKKWKKLLRRQKNFKGYETPLSLKSVSSEHPSYLLSPTIVRECHTKPTYNRFPKDRYGIYLPPADNDFQIESLTTDPREFGIAIEEDKPKE